MSDVVHKFSLDDTIMEPRICNLLNLFSLNKTNKFFHEKLIYDSAEVPDLIKDEIKQYKLAIDKKGINSQTDIIIYNKNNVTWKVMEFKWDHTEYFTRNLCFEFQDVFEDGKVTITGPERSAAKGEEYWGHLRDRKMHHRKDVILYLFKTPELLEYITKNKARYKINYSKNVSKFNHTRWTTHSYLVPEKEIIRDKIGTKTIVCDDLYQKFLV